MKWVLDGASEHEIKEAIQQQWPDVDAKPIIVQAMTDIAKASESDPNLVKGWCIEAARRVYQKAVEVADHQTALRAIKLLSDLA